MRTNLVLAIACALVITACRQQPTPAFQFVAQACEPSLQAKNVTCGTVTVPEDYAKQDGRKIALNVIDFHALDPGEAKAAQFDLEGGPGFAVTESADFYATDGEAYRKSRDVVLFDMRGTGASNPLRCAAIEQHQQAQPRAPLYPPELVADCARQLSATADLGQYTTAAASRDIEAVRQALGFDRVDLNALSYGTTLALRYIADHPERVRTAVLTGTVPADKTPPAHHALAAENGLRLLFEACAADAACATQYPALASDLDRALQRIDPDTRAVLMEKLRTMLYLPMTSRRVPSIVHAAADGNFDFLDKSTGARRVFSDGVYLSITCSESLARIDIEKAIAEADATRFGSYRIKRQREACAQWPLAPEDPDLFSTGVHNVPVLFFSGAFDPVSPGEWTKQASTQFPNGRVVVVPQGAHVLEGLSGLDACMDAMVLRFVATRSTSNIDASCVAAMEAGPFAPP